MNYMGVFLSIAYMGNEVRAGNDSVWKSEIVFRTTRMELKWYWWNKYVLKTHGDFYFDSCDVNVTMTAASFIFHCYLTFRSCWNAAPVAPGWTPKFSVCSSTVAETGIAGSSPSVQWCDARLRTQACIYYSTLSCRLRRHQRKVRWQRDGVINDLLFIKCMVCSVHWTGIWWKTVRIHGSNEKSRTNGEIVDSN